MLCDFQVPSGGNNWMTLSLPYSKDSASLCWASISTTHTSLFCYISLSVKPSCEPKSSRRLLHSCVYFLKLVCVFPSLAPGTWSPSGISARPWVPVSIDRGFHSPATESFDTHETQRLFRRRKKKEPTFSPCKFCWGIFFHSSWPQLLCSISFTEAEGGSTRFTLRQVSDWSTFHSLAMNKRKQTSKWKSHSNPNVRRFHRMEQLILDQLERKSNLI